MTHRPLNPSLPPPEPPDAPDTRPPFNLLAMAAQVIVIQTTLAGECAEKMKQSIEKEIES